MTTVTKNKSQQLSALQTILLSGLIIAILDFIAAAAVFNIWYKLTPTQVIQFIASSIFGPSAFDGSTLMIIAGSIIHTLISYIIALAYFYAYPKINFLQKYPIIAGLLYGLGFWLIMNLLIIPNTNVQQSPFDPALAVVSIIWHMVLVGLPAALITRKYYNNIN
ncbi:MAG: DUF1440 domain-containing protein [Sphingobacteriales bacterium]|nr:DUF1440 domain-containing protein [Sphingobacteriales bacterium]